MRLKPMLKPSIILLSVLFLSQIVTASPAYSEWHFGIGTGLSLLSVNGDQGFNSALAGPIKFKVKLDPEDFNDMTKSAIGFGGYATDGTWLIQYIYSNLELEDTSSTYLPLIDTTAAIKINFTTTVAELTASYPIYDNPSFNLLVDAGARYTKHEFDNSLRLTGTVNGFSTRKFDQGWTDALIGITVNVPLSEQWTWDNRANVAFGESDGTYSVQTRVTWRFHKNWSTSLHAKYVSVNFENGSMGDSDWYLYEADEKALGLNILFNW